MPSQTTESTGQPQPLRLWPGVVAAVLLLLVRLGLPIVWPEQTAVGVLGGIAGGLFIIVWWAFFSRARRSERWGAIVLMVVGLVATWRLVDVSISTGAMGGLFPMLAVPPLSVAFVAWAVASRGLANGPRRATMAATILLACGAWTLAKTGGFSGSFDNDLMWRWAQTPEDRLVADPSAALPAAPAAAEVPREIPTAPVTVPAATSAESAAPVESKAEMSADWPSFRGASRDGIVRGVRIETDWSKHPPVALWRRPIGPGWSSFAVHGDVLYTQEQRGEDEIVAAYRVSTGAPVWTHRDAARFWESNGGAGPRATPTFNNGHVYAFGATGILNALDAANGRLVWSRNVSADSKTKVPDWGFASSPLLIGDLVIVAAAGKLVAYDVATGAPLWFGADGGSGYSSPHVLTIHGVPQILLLDAHGATSVAPADGTRLWDVTVTSSAMSAPIVQPALTADGDVLICDGQARGMYRIAIGHEPGGWTVSERWMSNALKPLYNDFVVHNGHAFGFDGSILACIDLADGKRKWKGGRYGNGQLILLADQDLLLVVSEEGELALVAAASEKFTEFARVPAIEGKTWNHPVLVGDVLLVRNGEEMAAFRLPLQGR